VVPFLLATKLEERGAKHVAAPDFQKRVVASGNLVTGQNPASAAGVAEKMVELLKTKN
jgi:putative intracellular protease/amidase